MVMIMTMTKLVMTKNKVNDRYAEEDDNHHAVWRRHNGRHYERLVLETLNNL